MHESIVSRPFLRSFSEDPAGTATSVRKRPFAKSRRDAEGELAEVTASSCSGLASMSKRDRMDLDDFFGTTVRGLPEPVVDDGGRVGAQVAGMGAVDSDGTWTDGGDTKGLPHDTGVTVHLTVSSTRRDWVLRPLSCAEERERSTALSWRRLSLSPSVLLERGSRD